MSVLAWVGLGLAGGVGAVARALLTQAVTARVGRRPSLPYGTLAVNLSGAFALGLVAASGLDGDALRIVATGLLGAFTTFSTWMLETERTAAGAAEAGGSRGRAALNVVVSLAAGLLAVWLGRDVV